MDRGEVLRIASTTGIADPEAGGIQGAQEGIPGAAEVAAHVDGPHPLLVVLPKLMGEINCVHDKIVTC